MIFKKKATRSFISIMLSLAMIVSGLTVTTSKVSAADTITSLSVTGVPLPTAGAKAETFTIGVPSDANYTAELSDKSNPWFDKGKWSDMETTDTFLAGNTYYLSVVFKPKDGYEMADISQITAIIPELENAGYNISCFQSGNSRTNVSVRFVFTVHKAGEYLVSFDPNGGYLKNGEGGMNTTGLKLMYLPNATKDGYVLEGWYTEKTGGEKVTTSKMYYKDTKLYAHYVPKEQATMISNANVDIAKPVVGEHPDFTAKTDMDGYYVMVTHWFRTDRDGKNKVELTNTYVFEEKYSYQLSVQFVPKEKYLLSEDSVMTINGEETRSSGALGYRAIDYDAPYKVTLDANGGSVTPGYVYTNPGVDYSYQKLDELPTPVRAGWNFAGWYSSKTADVSIDIPVTTGKKFTEDTTIYAIWTHDTLVESVNVKFELPKPGQKIEGVKNYVVNPSGSLMTGENGEIAVWLIRKSVSNNTLNYPGYDNFKAGGKYYLTFTPMSNTGYAFRFDKYIDIVKYNNAPGNYIGSIDGVSFWSYEYTIPGEKTITLDANGGTVAQATYSTTDWLTPELNDAERTGYRFEGWFTNESGGTKVETGTELSGDVTFYARWISEDQIAANSVIELISEIGVVTKEVSSGMKITAAYMAYSSLTDVQKELVTNYSTLLSAQKTYLQLIDGTTPTPGTTPTLGTSATPGTTPILGTTPAPGITPTTTPTPAPASVAVAKVKKISKATAKFKSKKLSITWSKLKGVNGYQVKVGLNSKVTKSAKAYTVTKNISKKIIKYTKMKKGKKLYIKVRAYQVVNGKKVYGKYCKVKAVKVK